MLSASPCLPLLFNFLFYNSAWEYLANLFFFIHKMQISAQSSASILQRDFLLLLHRWRWRSLFLLLHTKQQPTCHGFEPRPVCSVCSGGSTLCSLVHQHTTRHANTFQSTVHSCSFPPLPSPPHPPPLPSPPPPPSSPSFLFFKSYYILSIII